MSMLIRPADLGSSGRDLSRPECVLVTPEGTIFCSDARGGVMHIAPDGGQKLLGGHNAVVSNGIAATADGEFLIANVAAAGGVWRLGRDGGVSKLDIRVDGRELPPVNFVHIDHQGRLWISVSGSGDPDPNFTRDVAEGFIVVGDANGFRVAATGLGWTNELRVSEDSATLFVNETFGRRLLRFAVASDGTLSNRAVVAEFGVGDYPDGLSLDAEGGLWVVSIISNRIYRVAGGDCSLVFEDSDPEVVGRLEALFTGPGLRRTDLLGIRTGSRVNNISSIAFGGDDMRTAYLGSLNDTVVWSFRSPVAGAPSPFRQGSVALSQADEA